MLAAGVYGFLIGGSVALVIRLVTSSGAYRRGWKDGWRAAGGDELEEDWDE